MANEWATSIPPASEHHATVYACARMIDNSNNVRLSLGPIGGAGAISEIITAGEAKALWIVLGNYLAYAEGAGVEIDPNAPVGHRLAKGGDKL
jgi:hypothetical protein